MPRELKAETRRKLTLRDRARVTLFSRQRMKKKVAVLMNGHLCFTEPGEALVCGAKTQASDHQDAHKALLSTSLAPPWGTWALLLVKLKT